jgi:putative aldouronate transport system substrate-binding protein
MTIGISDNLRRLNYGQAGIIIPLDEYYENLGQAFYARCAEAGLDPELDVLRRVRSPDGKIYGAPFYDWHIPNVLSLRAWINKTWLDRLGLDVPKTSEDLIEVLKAFRDNDPNGNGKADEIPMIGFEEGWHSSALDYIMNMFIYSDDNNYYLPFTETGGVVDVAYDKPEYKEYLRYTNSLIKEGLLSPLSITQDNAQYDALLSSDPPVLGIAVSANFHLLSASTDNYVPLEAMQGPEGVQYVTTYVPPCSAKMAISRDCEIPDIAFLFMNYQNIDKWERIAYRWGVEGEDWVKADEDDYHPYESIGYKSDIVLINDIWAVPNNNIWAGSVEFPCIVTADQQLASPISENAPEFKYAESYLINEPYSIAFDDIPSNLSYTIEEYEEWSDLRTSLKSYVLEARTLFCMGEMDVDKDWESYIEELNNLRYKEILAVDQAAYDRMNRMTD